MSEAALPQAGLPPIHPSTWKVYSPKSIYSILHSPLRRSGVAAHLPIRPTSRRHNMLFRRIKIRDAAWAA
jgi:hypothetical protein